MSEHKDLLPCVQQRVLKSLAVRLHRDVLGVEQETPSDTDTGGGDEEEKSWRVGSGELNLDTGYEELEEGRTNS